MLNFYLSILKDKGALLVLIIAPVLYALYYPLPYLQHSIQNVPLVVIDQDQSAASRQFIRLLEASPQLDIIAQDQDPGLALELMSQQQALGWLLIPEGYERSLLRQQPADILVEGHGGLLLAGSEIISTVTEIGLSMGVGVKQQRLLFAGQDRSQSAVISQPTRLNSLALYNWQQSYGAYIVPAVWVMVIQQSLLIGICLWRKWREERQLEMPKDWQQLLGFSSISLAVALMYQLWALPFQGYPSAGPSLALLLTCLCFALACTSLGLWLCRIFVSRESSMLFLLTLGLPFFFGSGYPIPNQGLPPLLSLLAKLLPSTHGIEAMVSHASMQLELQESLSYMLKLLALSLLYFVLYLLWPKAQSWVKKQHHLWHPWQGLHTMTARFFVEDGKNDNKSPDKPS